jgi:hypothetical protein
VVVGQRADGHGQRVGRGLVGVHRGLWIVLRGFGGPGRYNGAVARRPE